MAVAEPRSITNAYLKARYELERSTSSNNLILSYIVAKNKVDKQLTEIYHFDETLHNAMFNKANIVSTGGCGCKVCDSLCKYVNSKLFLHKFKKSYYDPWGVTSIFRLFDDSYSSFCKNSTSTKLPVVTLLTEEEFFETRVEELKRDIQQRRITFISIKEAVNTLLEV